MLSPDKARGMGLSGKVRASAGVSIFWPQRMAGILLAFAGLLAIVTATLGLYAVLAYSGLRRTRELGVRIALSASCRDILRSTLGHGMILAAIGIVAGIGLAAAGTRLLGSLLYGVTATDTFAGVAALLLGTVLVACYVPARAAPPASTRSSR